MPRDIPVGNGRLLVNFDENYSLRDIYFPHVGKENHSGEHRSRFGIWSEGTIAWVDSSWNIDLEYAEETLITHVTTFHDGLGVTLHCSDLVDYREDIYMRKIVVKNIRDREREIRLFFHHDFHILESPLGDTAYYDPDERALIHYKADRYFLCSGMRDGLQGIDQYAVGIKEFRGFEGSWRDAEDGILSGNPIAQGSVDSVISLTITIPPGGEKPVYYWICAGRNYAEVSGLNRMISGHGIEHFIRRTESYWRAWVNKEGFDLSSLSDPVRELYKKSLLIMRTNIDSQGAIIAGNDSDIQHFARDTYSYMWPRDGALAAYSLDLAGYHGLTREFFDFCLKIIGTGKESVGYFLHKYNPDGSLGSSWHPWTTNSEKRLPIQEDGTALILWALWKHFNRFRDIEFAVKQYESLVIRCGDFLSSYRDTQTGLPLPSYDLWEESWGVHTFTVSAVYAGLRAAEEFARFFGDSKRVKIYGRAADEVRTAIESHLYSPEQGRFLRSLVPQKDGSLKPDTTMDASIYAPFYFGAFSARDEWVVKTMEAIRERLWVRTEVGGVARYEGDIYYRASDNLKEAPGNPWFICTLWLAQWYTARAESLTELEDALAIMEWVAARALPSGVLAEQLNPLTGRPVSVSPLSWSHAAFVSTVLEYMQKRTELNICPGCGQPLKDFHRHG